MLRYNQFFWALLCRGILYQLRLQFKSALEKLAQAWLAAVASARVTARRTGGAHHDASFSRYTSDCAVSVGIRVVRMQSVTLQRML